jgi:hypothetical protein
MVKGAMNPEKEDSFQCVIPSQSKSESFEMSIRGF